MHITKLFSKAVLLSSLFLVSAWAMAHEGHTHDMQQQHAEHHQMPQGHAMSYATMSEAECAQHRQGEHAHMNHAEHATHCQTAQPNNQVDQKAPTDSKNQDLKGDNHAHH